jgi:hypothetical protein
VGSCLWRLMVVWVVALWLLCGCVCCSRTYTETHTHTHTCIWVVALWLCDCSRTYTHTYTHVYKCIIAYIYIHAPEHDGDDGEAVGDHLPRGDDDSEAEEGEAAAVDP